MTDEQNAVYREECILGLRVPPGSFTVEELPFDFCLLPLGKGHYEEFKTKYAHKLTPPLQEGQPSSPMFMMGLRWVLRSEKVPMLTDRERYLQLFRETNVPFTEDNDEGKNDISVGDVDWPSPAPLGGVVKCYGGFFVRLEFDRAGKLTEFGIWE